MFKPSPPALICSGKTVPAGDFSNASIISCLWLTGIAPVIGSMQDSFKYAHTFLIVSKKNEKTRTLRFSNFAWRTISLIRFSFPDCSKSSTLKETRRIVMNSSLTAASSYAAISASPPSIHDSSSMSSGNSFKTSSRFRR